MKHPPVSPYVRAILAVFGAFAVWQVAWLLAAKNAFQFYLPATLSSITGWAGVWSIAAIMAGTAVVTGRDLIARMAFGAMAVVSAAGAITVMTDTRPLNIQFWSFGMAVTLAAACLVMLLSPMQYIPTHTKFIDFPGDAE